MKLNILSAILIVLFGMVLVIIGAVLLWRNSPYANYAVMAGLVIVFVGYVLVVIRVFHRR